MYSAPVHKYNMMEWRRDVLHSQEQQRSKARDFNDLLIMAACVFWVDLSHAHVAAV